MVVTQAVRPPPPPSPRRGRPRGLALRARVQAGHYLRGLSACTQSISENVTPDRPA